MNQLQQKLQKEQAEESKTAAEHVKFMITTRKINELTSQLEEAQMMSRAQVQSSLNTPGSSELQYDVLFPTSEDKESFVRELADTLINDYAMKVWYDEFSIKWGDSLRRSIDKGLSASRFGIVVISRNFIDKGWTNYELDGLIQKEMDAGKTILPIWHDITKDEVRAFSPSLAGRMALNTAMQTIQEIAEALQEILAS